MATYRPSFVDVSGLTEGISRGLEMAAMEKKRQDSLAEQSVDEYLKNYRPDKLRDNDIGVFTGAFNDYKQAALRYSRMNRGGAKPQEIAFAKAIMDKSLNNLNSLYTNSASSANKLAEYADYIKKARMSGLDIPQEVTANYNMLLSNSIDKLDSNKIPSVYDFELIKKEPDYKRIETILNSTGAAPITETRESKYEIGKLNNQSINGIMRTTYSSRPVQPTIKGIELAMQNDNALKRDANQLYGLFKANPSVFMPDFQKLGITEEMVTPSVMYSLQYIKPTLVGKPEKDTKGAELQIQGIKMSSDKAYRDAMLRLQQRRLSASEQKAKDEKRGQIDPVKELSDFESRIKGTKQYQTALKNDQYIPVPDVKGFSGVSKYKFANANIDYIWYFPKSNKYVMKTDAPGEGPRTLSPKEIRNILVQGTRGATNKPYAVDETMPSLEELESVGYTSDAEMMNLFKNLDFGGGQE
jgi:hypothetical protein